MEKATSGPEHTAASQNAYKSAFIGVNGVFHLFFLYFFNKAEEPFMPRSFGQILIMIKDF